MLQLFTNIKYMKSKKIVIVLAVIIIIIGGVIWFGYNFAPGSYPYREEYELNVPESTLVKAIRDFKKDNPQYIVPEKAQLVDGRSNETEQDYWYHIYIYYEDENRVIYCWTRPAGKGKTTFALIGVGQGLELGNWKMINKDFSRSENKEEKKKFEKRILNKIKEKLNAKASIQGL